MKLIVALIALLSVSQAKACDDLSTAAMDLKAAHSVFQKTSQLIRDQHPDHSFVKMELKVKSQDNRTHHYLVFLQNEETQDCQAYYISSEMSGNCQASAMVGAKVNVGNSCGAL